MNVADLLTRGVTSGAFDTMKARQEAAFDNDATDIMPASFRQFAASRNSDVEAHERNLKTLQTLMALKRSPNRRRDGARSHSPVETRLRSSKSVPDRSTSAKCGHNRSNTGKTVNKSVDKSQYKTTRLNAASTVRINPSLPTVRRNLLPYAPRSCSSCAATPPSAGTPATPATAGTAGTAGTYGTAHTSHAADGAGAIPSNVRFAHVAGQMKQRQQIQQTQQQNVQYKLSQDIRDTCDNINNTDKTVARPQDSRVWPASETIAGYIRKSAKNTSPAPFAIASNDQKNDAINISAGAGATSTNIAANFSNGGGNTRMERVITQHVATVAPMSQTTDPTGRDVHVGSAGAASSVASVPYVAKSVESAQETKRMAEMNIGLCQHKIQVLELEVKLKDKLLQQYKHIKETCTDLRDKIKNLEQELEVSKNAKKPSGKQDNVISDLSQKLNMDVCQNINKMQYLEQKFKDSSVDNINNNNKNNNKCGTPRMSGKNAVSTFGNMSGTTGASRDQEDSRFQMNEIMASSQDWQNVTKLNQFGDYLRQQYFDFADTIRINNKSKQDKHSKDFKNMKTKPSAADMIYKTLCHNICTSILDLDDALDYNKIKRIKQVICNAFSNFHRVVAYESSVLYEHTRSLLSKLKHSVQEVNTFRSGSSWTLLQSPSGYSTSQLTNFANLARVPSRSSTAATSTKKRARSSRGHRRSRGTKSHSPPGDSSTRHQAGKKHEASKKKSPCKITKHEQLPQALEKARDRPNLGPPRPPAASKTAAPLLQQSVSGFNDKYGLSPIPSPVSTNAREPDPPKPNQKNEQSDDYSLDAPFNLGLSSPRGRPGTHASHAANVPPAPGTQPTPFELSHVATSSRSGVSQTHVCTIETSEATESQKCVEKSDQSQTTRECEEQSESKTRTKSEHVGGNVRTDSKSTSMSGTLTSTRDSSRSSHRKKKRGYSARRMQQRRNYENSKKRED